MERIWQGKTQADLVYVFAASSVEGEPVRKIAVAGHYFARLHCRANDVVLMFSGLGPLNVRSKAHQAFGVGPRPWLEGALNPRAPRILGHCLRHK